MQWLHGHWYVSDADGIATTPRRSYEQKKKKKKIVVKKFVNHSQICESSISQMVDANSIVGHGENKEHKWEEAPPQLGSA